MKHYPDGDLRAWLDRELEPEQQAAVGAHLEACPECRALRERLSARASFVMGALDELPAVRVAREPAPSGWSWVPAWRWAVPPVAIAACLAVLMWMSPKHPAELSPVVPVHQNAKSEVHPVPAASLEAQPAVPHPMANRPAALHKKPAQQPETEHFVALDNEPIESGVVVRVSSQSGGFEADVIVGPDGRARAIRVLSESD